MRKVVTLEVRNGTTTQWTAANPVLAKGEPGYDGDLNVLKIGDGVTAWSALEGMETGGDGVPKVEVRSTPKDPYQLSLNYDLNVEDSDIYRLVVNGKLVMWMNEWGAIRGTSPHSWGDALFRGIRENADGINNGNYVELVDRRTSAPAQKIHARRWTDGALIRNDIVMSDVWVREGSASLPSNLPINTVVFEVD